MVTISIVTVCFNSAKTIEQTIKSVINQSYNNIEYIIIDGGSTDGTLDVIKKYEPYISYWVSEPDKGIYDAMNKGIKVASGELLGFIGSDDVYEPGAIAEVVQCFNESRADVVYGNISLDYHGKKELLNYKNINLDNLAFENNLCHQAVFVRLVLQKNNPFDCTYSIAADYNFLSELYFSGYRFQYVNCNIATYRTDGLSGSKYHKREKEFEKISVFLQQRFNKVAIRNQEIKEKRLIARMLMLQTYLLKRMTQNRFSCEIYPKRKLIIFGTGKVGCRMYDIFANHINMGEIVCFWDSNISKCGTVLCDHFIEQPNLNRQDCLVLIASSDYEKDMISQLDKMGLERNKDYIGWQDGVKEEVGIYLKHICNLDNKNIINNV